MKFLPRRDLWLSFLMWFCMITLVFAGLSPLFYAGSGIVAGPILFLMCITIAGFMAWLWISTFYEFGQSDLIIHYGPFTKSIPFNLIAKAKPIRSWMASAATSINRIELQYGSYNAVHISPLDQETFLLELMHRCPGAKIEIKYG